MVSFFLSMFRIKLNVEDIEHKELWMATQVTDDEEEMYQILNKIQNVEDGTRSADISKKITIGQ